MAQDIEMPALGESVTEGTVSRWLKKVGDTVSTDEPILEVSTDKVDSEVPSPADGVLLEILVEEDETVDVGTVVARVGSSDEAGSQSAGSDAPKMAADSDGNHAAVASTDGEGAQFPANPEPASEAEVQVANPAASAESAADATDVSMPALGESVSEGTVSRWLKAVGDSVEADEPIVEVSTDKVDSEVPSPVAGTVLEILVQEDETVDVGTVLCKIGSGVPSSESDSAPSKQESVSSSASTPSTPVTPAAPPAPSAAPSAPVAPPAPPAAPALPSSLDDLPGAGIPSSIRKEGEKKVVEWAYPQASSGYPGTMRPEGQLVPSAPSAPPAPAAPAKPAEKAPVAKAQSTQKSPIKGGSVYVTPIVRKLAKEQGIELSEVTGTGVGGRIRKEDVLQAAKEKQAAQSQPPSQTRQKATGETKQGVAKAQPAVSSLRGKTEKMPRIRQSIAKAMMNSLQSTAQLTSVVEVDVTRIASLRARAKDQFLAREGTKLTFLPFFIKAATEALKTNPKINSRVNDKTNEVTYFDYENVGIAVDSPRGLMVPVIKNCGDLTIAGIAKKTNELAAKVRDGKIGPDELSGGTFTITNTGSLGSLFDTPVVNYPEEAILGLGGIVRRPVVIKDADGMDTIAIRSMVHLSLSYDHRLIDGGDAVRYLVAVKKRLEEGDFDAEVGL